MKRFKLTAFLLAGALSVTCLIGCGGGNGGGDSSSSQTEYTLKASDFTVDGKFMTFADVPPDPNSTEAISLYKDLGLDIYLMTEDYVSLLDRSTGKYNASYKNAIQKAVDAGLEVWIRNYYNDPDYFQLDEVKSGNSNYSTGYNLQPRNFTDEFNGTGVTGFYMADEAFMHTLKDVSYGGSNYSSKFAAFDQYEKLIEWKNTYYPDLFWHMNHVPSSSFDHYASQLMADEKYEGEYFDYADFINAYIDLVIRKLTSGGRSVCLDNYPFNTIVPDGISDSYLYDLLTCALATKNYNATAEKGQEATFGICLQTFMNTSSTGKLRDITMPEEVTFQMYAGMACGAELFEYFLYNSIPGAGMYGIMNDSVEKRIYDIVKEANDRAFPFADVIRAFDWKGLITSAAGTEAQRDLSNERAFNAVEGMTATETGVLKTVSSRVDTVVGCFEKDGKDGYMVVNYTSPVVKKSDTVKLSFDGCKEALVFKSVGGKLQSENVRLLDGSYQITIQSGDCAFIIPA